MADFEEKDIESVLPLEKLEQNLTKEIIEEPDPALIKDKLQVFNFYQTKKNLIRVQKYNELLDRISDQMTKRIEQRPDEFSHLIRYPV